MFAVRSFAVALALGSCATAVVGCARLLGMDEPLLSLCAQGYSCVDGSPVLDGAEPDSATGSDASRVDGSGDAYGDEIGIGDDGGRVDAATAACPSGRTLAWSVDFSDANWVANAHATVVAGQANTSVVMDPARGAVLQVAYPQNSASLPYSQSSGAPVGGLELRAPLPAAGVVTSVFSSYWIRFDPQFPWVKGGKLPGVCGGDCPLYGVAPTGAGFSMRYAWHVAGIGGQYAQVSAAQAPAGNYNGRDLGVGTWKFTTGTWHHIQEEIVLNSGSNGDGISRIWFDKPATSPPDFEEKDIEYLDRTANPAVGIDNFLFSTFFGGHDASWATPVTTYAYFADLVVCE